MNSNPGEVITIFVGQAGSQVANSCWELFCLEHGIRPNGFVQKGYEIVDNSFYTFFEPTPVGKLIPRTLIIDLEPTVIDEIRTGFYKELFDPASLINGKEDAANNYARGFYTNGMEAIEAVCDRVRQEAELCSNLNGFMVFRALGGGTGSGFTALLLNQLANEFGKKTKMDVAIYPAQNISPTIVEPYNSVLTTHGTIDNVDCCFAIDNEALYGICSRNLDIQCPMYLNLNRLEAQLISNMTTSLRFEGVLNVSLEEVITNLVPYPRIHYPLVTFSPITHQRKALNNELPTHEITQECFEPWNQMIKCDPRKGAYLSCVLLYRGDVNASDVNKTVNLLKEKKTIKFVNWSPTGFKVGINYQPPTTIPTGDLAKMKRSVTMLSNNTAIKKVWIKLARKYDLMYQKRAFVYHYVAEGMEESEFQESRENLDAIIKDYKEVER